MTTTMTTMILIRSLDGKLTYVFCLVEGTICPISFVKETLVGPLFFQYLECFSSSAFRAPCLQCTRKSQKKNHQETPFLARATQRPPTQITNITTKNTSSTTNLHPKTQRLKLNTPPLPSSPTPSPPCPASSPPNGTTQPSTPTAPPSPPLTPPRPPPWKRTFATSPPATSKSPTSRTCRATCGRTATPAAPTPRRFSQTSCLRCGSGGRREEGWRFIAAGAFLRRSC